MPGQRRYLIWDFDGTLGYRPGQWSGAAIQVLRRFAGVEVDLEMVRPFMRKGFPWHNPMQPNPPMRAAEEWWDALTPLFEEAFAACGQAPAEARALAGKMRPVYTDITEWKVFDDTREVLHGSMDEGWRHVILSNHVPELPELIAGLGLSPLIHRIVNSAETGFEKPHPGAYRSALAVVESSGPVWMIGDNVHADVLGAEAAGLRAILVRSQDARAQRCALTLHEVASFLRE